MKYVCFGYLDEDAWSAMSESEQQRFIDNCFAYDDVLRKNGHGWPSALWFSDSESVWNRSNAHYPRST